MEEKIIVLPKHFRSLPRISEVIKKFKHVYKLNGFNLKIVWNEDVKS